MSGNEKESKRVFITQYVKQVKQLSSAMKGKSEWNKCHSRIVQAQNQQET